MLNINYIGYVDAFLSRVCVRLDFIGLLLCCYWLVGDRYGFVYFAWNMEDQFVYI